MSSPESSRQIVHMSVVVLAFLLRFLSAPWAFFLVFALLIHNYLLLPRYSPGLFRPDERGLGGILSYPLALCVLILLLPQHLEVVAGAWALLAVGDGLATLVGRSRPLAPLPWNPEKSLGGLLAFVVGGTLACSILVVWTAPETGQSAWIFLTLGVCALVAGLVESLLLPINDNLLVPVAAAASLSLLLAADVGSGICTLTAGVLIFAVFLNVVLAIVAYRVHLVSVNGASGAAVIGALVYILGGPGAYFLLVLFLVVESGVAWSKFTGKPAQENWSQRGSRHALSLCGFAVLLSFLWAITDGVDSLLKLMYVAALATALANRVAGEVGSLVDLSMFRLTATETSVPVEGSLWGILAAVIFVGCGGIAGLCDTSLVPAAIAGATIGLWGRSVMAATAGERKVVLDNEWLSFMSTVVGALCAAIVAYLLVGGELHS
jgi:uncharacterized protein (TIGR00297 family)